MFFLLIGEAILSSYQSPRLSDLIKLYFCDSVSVVPGSNRVNFIYRYQDQPKVVISIQSFSSLNLPGIGFKHQMATDNVELSAFSIHVSTDSQSRIQIRYMAYLQFRYAESNIIRFPTTFYGESNLVITVNYQINIAFLYLPKIILSLTSFIISQITPSSDRKTIDLGVNKESTQSTSLRNLVINYQFRSTTHKIQKLQLMFFAVQVQNSFKQIRYNLLIYSDEITGPLDGRELPLPSEYKGNFYSFFGAFYKIKISFDDRMTFGFSLEKSKLLIQSPNEFASANFNFMIPVVYDCSQQSPFYLDQKCFSVCPDGKFNNYRSSICQNCTQAFCSSITPLISFNFTDPDFPKYYVNMSADFTLPQELPLLSVYDLQTRTLWKVIPYTKGLKWVNYQLIVPVQKNHTLVITYINNLVFPPKTLSTSMFTIPIAFYRRSKILAEIRRDFYLTRYDSILVEFHLKNISLHNPSAMRVFINSKAIQFKSFVLNNLLFINYQTNFSRPAMLTLQLLNSSALYIRGPYTLPPQNFTIDIPISYTPINYTFSTHMSTAISCLQTFFSLTFLVGLSHYSYLPLHLMSQLYLVSQLRIVFPQELTLLLNISHTQFKIPHIPQILKQRISLFDYQLYNTLLMILIVVGINILSSIVIGFLLKLCRNLNKPILYDLHSLHRLSVLLEFQYVSLLLMSQRILSPSPLQEKSQIWVYQITLQVLMMSIFIIPLYKSNTNQGEQDWVKENHQIQCGQSMDIYLRLVQFLKALLIAYFLGRQTDYHDTKLQCLVWIQAAYLLLSLPSKRIRVFYCIWIVKQVGMLLLYIGLFFYSNHYLQLQQSVLKAYGQWGNDAILGLLLLVALMQIGTMCCHLLWKLKELKKSFHSVQINLERQRTTRPVSRIDSFIISQSV